MTTAADRTFNRITVDGDTSTNDMALALANGAAENRPLNSRGLDKFQKGLTSVMADLARMIVEDGEGATKVVRVVVEGARSLDEAERAARSIANSSLVKTAFYGQDPNWGRIMAVLGRSVYIQEEAVGIWINDIQIVQAGLGCGQEAERHAAEQMKHPSFDLVVDLGQDSFQAQITTCDLTHDYISINADYRT
jgi:glutamate N-acetyltransferase/amino-acid N-acetyltransferase